MIQVAIECVEVSQPTALRELADFMEAMPSEDATLISMSYIDNYLWAVIDPVKEYPR